MAKKALKKVVIIDAGGRGFAMAEAVEQGGGAPIVLPGNAGTILRGWTPKDVVIPLNHKNEWEELKTFMLKQKATMLVVGSEEYLQKGIIDSFMNDGDRKVREILLVGPTKKAAMLETSKLFAKKFMIEFGIPTASYSAVDSVEEGLHVLEHTRYHSPYVLKKDGPALGKGVRISTYLGGAKEDMRSLFKEFVTGPVLIEEFIKGTEFSAICLTDGNNYKMLPYVKDYKRAQDGDQGPMTGGMGIVSSLPFITKRVDDQIHTIINKVIYGMKQRRTPYKGFLYIGCILDIHGHVWVLEINSRGGDPETENQLPQIKGDGFMQLLLGVAKNNIDECTIDFERGVSVTLILCSGGYPGLYEKGKVITGLNQVTNCRVQHAGTALLADGETIVTSGGRVIALTAHGADINEARSICYENEAKITFDRKTCRTDIGEDILALEAVS